MGVLQGAEKAGGIACAMAAIIMPFRFPIRLELAILAIAWGIWPAQMQNVR